MEVWSTRRGGISYTDPAAPTNKEDIVDEDEIELPKSAKRKLCVKKCFRSLGYNDEDELLFTHASWELLERGIGKFSLAVDYLVYRSFYALVLIGATIFAVAIKSETVEAFPVVHLLNGAVHILYAALFTFHVVSGKTHRAKVGVIDVRKASAGSNVLSNSGSAEELGNIDIQDVAKRKPHPIQFLDKLVWFLLNITAATTLTAAFMFAFVTQRPPDDAAKFDTLNFVLIIYTTTAILIDVLANCIPLRIVHGIYPVFYFMLIVVPFTMLLEYFHIQEPTVTIQDWTKKPGGTALFGLKFMLVVFTMHCLLCGMAWVRSKIIYVFSRAKDTRHPHHRHLGPIRAEQLAIMIRKDKAAKLYVSKPNFHEEFEAHRQEGYDSQLRANEKKMIRFYQGARAFMDMYARSHSKMSIASSRTLLGSSKTTIGSTGPSRHQLQQEPGVRQTRKPYTPGMKFDEYLNNLTFDPDDEIVRAPKVRTKNDRPDYNWALEKRKEEMKRQRAISGVKRKIAPKKWNEFKTPPDSNTDLILANRKQHFGRVKHDATVEDINRNLEQIGQVQRITGSKAFAIPEKKIEKPTQPTQHDIVKKRFHDALSKQTPPTSKSKLSNSKLKMGPKPLYSDVLPPKIEKPKRVKSKHTLKEIKLKLRSISGVHLHDNWVKFKYARRKPKVIPRLKYYLGDTSYMPVAEPAPPPEAAEGDELMNNTSDQKLALPPPQLDERQKLEKEKAKLIHTLKEKLRPRPGNESMLHKIKEALRKHEHENNPVVVKPPPPPPVVEAKSEEPAAVVEETQEVEEEVAPPVRHDPWREYMPSEFIKQRELKHTEQRSHDKKGKSHYGPRIIELNVAFHHKKHGRHYKDKDRDQKKEQKKKKQPERVSKTRKASAVDPNRPESQLKSLLVVDVDHRTKMQILIKNKHDGILSKHNSTLRLHQALSDQEDEQNTDEPVINRNLKTRSVRSNLQLHTRANAIGPIPDGKYHPLRKGGPMAETNAISYHYLDDKLPHTGGGPGLDERALMYYKHHPGTHIHHPKLNADHPAGPHGSLRNAMRSHQRLKAKARGLNRSASSESVLNPVRKDEDDGNPLRVIAFHPIVQFRAVEPESKLDEPHSHEPEKKGYPPPKAREIHPKNIKAPVEEKLEKHKGGDKKSTALGRRESPQGKGKHQQNPRAKRFAYYSSSKHK